MKNEEFFIMVQTECCNCYVEVEVTPEQFLLEKEFYIDCPICKKKTIAK